MNPLRILATTAIAASLVSCASNNANEYDTPSPYGAPDAGLAAPTPANPIYDTPAAYEENAGIATSGVAALDPGAPADPGAPIPTAPSIPAAPTTPSNGAAIIHTVVKGDTLSGISAKYKVPIASIKAANRMTNDTVILDRKMVIPPN